MNEKSDQSFHEFELFKADFDFSSLPKILSEASFQYREEEFLELTEAKIADINQLIPLCHSFTDIRFYDFFTNQK